MKRAWSVVVLATGSVAVAIATGSFVGHGPPESPFDRPLPHPPSIMGPRAPMPTTVVSFEERIAGGLAGCGFYLQLPNDRIIGVTTAHSMGRSFTGVDFRLAVTGTTVGTFSRLHVPFGRPGGPGDMTGDFALLTPDAAPDPSIVLQPDPRGSPQPGERVSLYSGLGDGIASQRVFEGTVERITFGGVWLRMDKTFEPGLMSGSPVLSQHTAKVVGVTTAVLVAPGPLRIGISPIRVAVSAGMESH